MFSVSGFYREPQKRMNMSYPRKRTASFCWKGGKHHVFKVEHFNMSLQAPGVDCAEKFAGLGLSQSKVLFPIHLFSHRSLWEVRLQEDG